MKDTRKIYLVGFMGSGKTSVGIHLAERLAWPFIDLDNRIEERERKEIRAIFHEKGERYFRQVENEELRTASAEENAVVALGGGAFCSDKNQRIILGTGTTIWLDATLDLLFSRCAGEGSRPLFATWEQMELLFGLRKPFYEKAHLRVDITDLDIDQVVEKIVSELSR